MAQSLTPRWRSGRLLNAALTLVILMLAAAIGTEIADHAMRERVETVLRLRTRSADVLRLLVDAETGVRGYVISGDPTSLAPYRRTSSELGPTLIELRALADTMGGDTPARVDAVARAARAWRDDVAAPTVEARAAGDAESAAAVSSASSSQTSFDRIRREWEALDRYAVERERAENQNRVRFDLVSLSLLLGLGGLTGSAVWLGRRSAARAEARLAELGALVRSIEHGVVFYDAAGRVAMANPAVHDLFSVPFGSLRGRTALDAHEIVASRFEDPDAMRAAAERLPRLREVESAEVMLARPTPRVLRRSVTPVRLDDRRRVGTLELYEDVTAQRELDRTRDQFVATAAHDLRNPLAVVRGYAQLLQRQALRAGGVDVDRVQGTAEMVERQVDHMLELVSDLLDLSRANLGRLDLRREPLDAGQLVRDVVSRVAPGDMPGTWSARVRLNGPVAPVVVEADRIRLEQAVANLVSNALKYSPPEAPVDLKIERTGDELAVVVADRGPGIKPEELRHLGKPFYRTAGAIESGQPGTGLGLAIVRAVAEAHGGSLTADSTPGRGSTFRLALPGAEAAAGPVAPAAEPMVRQPERVAG